MEEVDLGVARAMLFPGQGSGSALILPGAGYGVQAPLLWFARTVLSASGRRVLTVDDRFGGTEDPVMWVDARARAALSYLGEEERPIIVGKSISTLAAPLAAELGLAAVWLTPLLQRDRSPVVDGLRAATAPVLVVGGTSDPAWNAQLARSMAHVEVLEIPGADHSLQFPRDPAASLDALRQIVQAMSDFLARLSSSEPGPR